MMTGMLEASQGDALVYGNSITWATEAVQQNLGLCQQLDVLFDEMTTVEHLKLVCNLKNVRPQLINDLIDETLKVVMLGEAKEKRAKELSGGMKRKLSLAMAIVC